MNENSQPGKNRRRITIGILAHVDAGKTTLSEALLYRTGEIRKLGRVDHRDAFLDDNQIERNRGITIFSKQARFTAAAGDGTELDITMIDTPGHVDFAAEMERALSVIDYALLVVSGTEGVQAHTRTLARMLRNRGIPVFMFINKMDIAVRQKADILDELSNELGFGAVDLTSAGDLTDDRFIDDVTLHSTYLADLVLEQEVPELTADDIAEAVMRGEIAPCIFGSALRLEGIDALLEALARFTREPVYRDGFAARVYKITSAENGERLSFLKVTGGTLKVRDKIGDDKITQIRLYSGSRYVTAESVSAGTVCAVTGLPGAIPGDVLGEEPASSEPVIMPYMQYTLTGPSGMDPYLVMKDMQTLAEEDPTLDVRWREDNGEIEIRLMGQVQLEVLAVMIKERFGYDVTFDTGRVLYLETISGTYEGAGHFEPLRHYAEVHLIIAPGERGSGIVITTETPEDELARNWQRLILTHIEEKQHIGVLTGAPLTDVSITLAAGRAHDKHTSGGDFREATYRAVRHALMQARADGKAVLLEPWYEYEIELPSRSVGRAMTDIKQMGGTQDDLEQNGDQSRIRGRVPASEIAGYQQILTGYTSAEGKLSTAPAGYAECHDPDKVIAASGYDPERDVDNTADSVFVSHGASDIVKWDEAAEHMHIQGVLRRRNEGPSEVYHVSGRPSGPPPDKEEAAAREAELNRIFEQTYGPVKSRLYKEARTKDVRPGKGRDDPRNIEIKAKHEKPSSVQSEASAPDIMIVDGYNLIYADPYLTELAARDMGSARDQLMDRLCNYAAYYGVEMTVVFDAYKVPYGAGSEEDYFGVNVIFTKEDEPADIRIGLMINGISGRRIYLVSSDSLVQQDGWGHGALRVSSGEFLKTIEKTEQEIRNRLK